MVDLSNEDQTFTFVVKKDSEIVATVPLTVRKGEKEASFTGDVLTNLPRGTYTVEEQKQTVKTLLFLLTLQDLYWETVKLRKISIQKM